jgi:hypothetical protein
MNRVYFDESGNTGEDLWNAEDPIFVLSSCRFSPESEKDLLDYFKHYRGPELKFSRLRRNEAGRFAVLRFLEDPRINSSSVAAFIVHKPFMVVTKYCDLVLEPSAREAGLNFYERGLNIATANLLTTVMPVVLTPTTWNNFLRGFVRIIRERTHAAFNEFSRIAELIYAHLEHSNKELSYCIAPALLVRPAEFFSLLGDHVLDPIIPSYYVLSDYWGRSLQQSFEICADQSKVLVKERQRLLALGDQNITAVEQGFDRRKMQFPLKVGTINAVDSTVERQVQLADIISGSLSGALKSDDRRKDGTFENQILKICFSRKFYVNAIWPDKEVDPKRLETDEPPSEGQFDLPTYTMMVHQQHPITRKPKSNNRDAGEDSSEQQPTPAN